MIAEGNFLLSERIPAPALGWLEAFLGRAARDPSIVAVIASGSAVRPVARSQDLDLLIVYTGSRPEIQPPPPMDIDIRFQSDDSVERAIASGQEFVIWALVHGRPLLDRDSFWRSLVSRWPEPPLPDWQRASERARRAFSYADELLRMGDNEASAEQLLSAITNRAWACLLRRGVLPASRPEIPEQLRAQGENALAEELERALRARPDPWEEQATASGREADLVGRHLVGG